MTTATCFAEARTLCTHPLVALSGYPNVLGRCLLLEMKRTLVGQQVSGLDLASPFGHCHSSFAAELLDKHHLRPVQAG